MTYLSLFIIFVVNTLLLNTLVMIYTYIISVIFFYLNPFKLFYGTVSNINIWNYGTQIWKFYGHYKWPQIYSVCCNHNPDLSSFMTYNVSPGMWQDWLPLVEQELLILPEYLSSLPIFSGVRVAQPLVFYVVFCGSL
jgi:hypothetical protein